MNRPLPRLHPDPAAPFPPAASALRTPNGLLAWGGDLHPERLLNAYRNGVFPWFSEGDPILWWSPEPRTVFDAATHRIARRMRRELRRSDWLLSADEDFDAVVEACASVPRHGQDGTWITAAMRQAYSGLHELGAAHSVEVRRNGRLIGGIYGVSAGTVFCGESMFSVESGASRVALAALCHALAGWGVDLLDAQLPNPHLTLLGARQEARSDYLTRLARPAPPRLPLGSWRHRFPLQRASELA
jgi:leucyl/phenylalanyl-tRNA--protein transferase